MSGRLAGPLAVLVGVCVLHAGLVVGTPYGFGDDCLEYAIPHATYLGTELAAGRWPLWNPFQDAGAPFLAQPPWMGPLYPGVLLFLLPAGRALDAGFLLHVLSFALGTYVLARRLGLGRTAAVLAAWAAAGGTPMRLLTRMGYLPEAVALSYLPWLLALAERALVGGARLAPCAAAAGLLLGLVHLGGHLVASGVTIVATALFALGLAGSRVRRERRGRPLAEAALLLVGAGLVGVLVGAPQLLPLALAGRESALAGGRAVASDEYAYLEEAWRFGAFLFPRFDATGKGHLYVGTALVPFVVLALGARREGERPTPDDDGARARDAHRVAGVLTLLVGAFVLALGNATPVWTWLRAALAPFRVFSYFYFFVTPLGLALALLAARGVERWGARLADGAGSAAERRADGARLGYALLALLGLAVATVVLASRPGATRALAQPYVAAGLPWTGAALTAVGLLAARAVRAGGGPRVARRAAAALAVIAFGELAVHAAASPRIPQIERRAASASAEPFDVARYFDRNAVVDALPREGTGRVLRVERVWYASAWQLKRNEGLVQRYEDVELASKLPFARLALLASALEQLDLDWVRALGRSKRAPETGEAALDLGETTRDVRVLDLLDVRALVTDLPVRGDGFERRVAAGPVRLHARARPRPRVYASAAPVPVAGVEAALDVALDPAGDPWARPAVEGLGASWPASAQGTAASPPPRILARTWAPGTVAATVESATDAVVVLGEMARAGWRVSIDGERAPTGVANGVLLAVRVPPGRHEVVARYAPRAFAVGLALAGAATVVALQLARRLLGPRARAPWRLGTPLWF